MQMIEPTAEAGALQERVAQMIDAGRIGAARPLLAAARKLSPPSAALSLLSARLAMRNGDLELAAQELETAIATYPTNPALRKRRAEARQLQGDRQGAARDAAEAVFLDRDDVEAKAILGITMLELGCAANAVACLSEAVAAAPTISAALAYREALAAALDATGDNNAALAVLIDAIALGPTNQALRNAAILLCMRRRDFTQAVHLAEQARGAGVADASTFGMKGHALASLGDHEAATLAYQEALKLEPNDPHVRHLVTAAHVPNAHQAGSGYVRAVFDDYAARFDAQLTSLGYNTPAQIRAALLSHPKISAGIPLGPVLDLGCGTGLVARAISDLKLGPIIGVDVSAGMLAQARPKDLYAELRETDILTELEAPKAERWPLVIAADVLCYFGALEAVLRAVHDRLEPGGWFLFSTEELLPHYDGTVPGNGSWALHRFGRHAHSRNYVHEAACEAGFRVIRTDEHTIRREAGANVPGILLVIERLGPAV